jgi:ribose transport system substrate-binding protein
MRTMMAALVAGAMVLSVSHSQAAEEKMNIAVFTKNATNPAYEAFRIAADQVARSVGRGPRTSFPASPTMSTSRRRWSSRS